MGDALVHLRHLDAYLEQLRESSWRCSVRNTRVQKSSFMHNSLQIHPPYTVLQDFGYKFEDNYVLPVAWQSAFSGAPVAS